MKEYIYAPWRVDYIRGPKEDGCIFCRMAAEEKDAKNYILHRGPTCYVVLNRFPYTTGHLMVVPYRHLADLEALNEAEIAEMMALAKKTVSIQKRDFSPQGFNVGFNLGQSAGAGIEEHIHLHVVPRWIGDSSFVATIGNTRVISISMESIFESLKKHFE
ncbi:MAG: HIT domain-containing protein [candidate division Zixibacteria bacterium]|nr:HIT domain-containing protein [candidate division Zixibacteria bacterium]